MLDFIGQIFSWMFYWSNNDGPLPLFGLRVLAFLGFLVNTVVSGAAICCFMTDYLEAKEKNSTADQRSCARGTILASLGLLTLWGTLVGLLIVGIHSLLRWLKEISFLSGLVEFFRLAFTSGKPKKVKLPKATAREV